VAMSPSTRAWRKLRATVSAGVPPRSSGGSARTSTSSSAISAATPRPGRCGSRRPGERSSDPVPSGAAVDTKLPPVAVSWKSGPGASGSWAPAPHPVVRARPARACCERCTVAPVPGAPWTRLGPSAVGGAAQATPARRRRPGAAGAAWGRGLAGTARPGGRRAATVRGSQRPGRLLLAGAVGEADAHRGEGQRHDDHQRDRERFEPGGAAVGEREDDAGDHRGADRGAEALAELEDAAGDAAEARVHGVQGEGL